MKHWSIFQKVFASMMVIVVLMVSTTALVFSQQILSFIRTIETKEITRLYDPLVTMINADKSQIKMSAETFYQQNQSFIFVIQDEKGQLIYKTPQAVMPSEFEGDFFYVVHRDFDYYIVAENRIGMQAFYDEMLKRGLMVFALLIFVCFVGAYYFSKALTKPIVILSDKVLQMPSQHPIDFDMHRSDEIGHLSEVIGEMYMTLQTTIHSLEDEVNKVKEMESAQKQFFMALSHELKTPLASLSFLMEAMLENIGDYANHPKYLKECLLLIDHQDEIVTDILKHLKTRYRLNLKPESLYESIEDVRQSFEQLIKQKHVTLKNDVNNELVIVTDKMLLDKIMTNIIQNAVQNTAPGNEIVIWCDEWDGTLAIHVFNPVTNREDKNAGIMIKPSGLGLIITERFIEMLGKDYEIEMTKEGTLFRMKVERFDVK